MKMNLLYMILAVTFAEVQSARILTVLPTATTSHYACARKIILELCNRGHEVVSISPYEEKYMPENLRWIPIKVESIMEAVPELMEDLEKKLDFTGAQRRLWKVMNKYSKYIFEKSEELRKFIEEDNSEFDLVIAEDFFQQIFYVLAYKYKAPLVLISTFGMGHYINEYTGNPLELAYVPHEFVDLYEDMNIFDRFRNMLNTFYDIWGRKYYSLSFQNELARDIFRNLGDAVPDLADLERNVSLVLINAHHSLSIVRPYTPNIIEIAGIHMDPVKPLDNDLKKVMDEAKDGVVLFSFGSMLDLAQQPKEKIIEILNALGSLKQRVILKWNSDDLLPSKFENIYPFKWIPQNDVLAHPNIRAFVTHGGLHSAIEAIHHGVPTICIPFYGDQPLNCLKSEKMGYGIALNMKDIDKNIFNKALNDILYVEKYKNRAEELSRIFKDRPIDVMNSTIYWLEYVIRHRGADFLKSPRRNIPWFKYYMVDIVSIMLASLYVIFVTFQFVANMLIRLKDRKKLKKT